MTCASKGESGKRIKCKKLAKRVIEKLKDLEKIRKIRIKLVEHTGDKLLDILHKSDSLSDEECGRSCDDHECSKQDFQYQAPEAWRLRIHLTPFS